MISQTTRNWLGAVAAAAAVVAAVSGLIGALYVLPYRVGELEDKVQAVDNRVKVLSDKREMDRELTTRIEERVIAVQKSVEVILKQNK